jgi:hypothetical protein
MRNLLAVALVLVVAFVASEFVGAVLQNRAQTLRAAGESGRPASSLATAPQDKP